MVGISSDNLAQINTVGIVLFILFQKIMPGYRLAQQQIKKADVPQSILRGNMMLFPAYSVLQSQDMTVLQYL